MTQAFAAQSSALPVILLQGSAMSAGSWRGLRDYAGARLDISVAELSRIRQLADLAAGTTPTLEELAEAAHSEITAIGAPVHLVGHDFGAVLALKLAAAYPGLVASLTLIEPTATNAIFPDSAGAWRMPREVKTTVASMRALLSEGDAWNAMRHFTDLVNGPGTWSRTSHTHKLELAQHAGETLADLIAIASDQMTPAELASVVCPTLLLSGECAGPMSDQVGRALRSSIPFLHSETIADAGHFPHLSDPHVTDPLIYDFLVRIDAEWQDTEITRRQAA